MHLTTKRKFISPTDINEKRNMYSTRIIPQEYKCMTQYCFNIVGFIDFMRKIKTMTGFTNLFSPYNLKKDYEVILCYFKISYKI